MSLAEKPVVTARNPFPGLRPYGTKDADFFFGREDQIHELLTRLRSARFLAVLGESGCGKSSLIRAGLLPPLIDGFMTSKGSEWRLAVMRPGAHPMDQLAQALAKPEALGIDESDPDTAMGFLQATLQGGSFGLIEAVQDANLSEGTRLLVLVDQFEELFRFSEDEDHDGLTEEDKSFIKLIIEASFHDVPIYVVMTMRSEYLGSCSLCPGLPDAINRGLYLVPRPTREQLRDAIQEPVKLSNGEITQRLVNKLLNDLGNESDQLPILQHVMMRLWNDSYGSGNRNAMDVARYEEIGGLSNALTLHIEEIFRDELNPRQRELAEIAFRNLTEMTDKAWVIRHPVKLSFIAAAAGADVPTVAEVLDKFRDEGRNFLMPPTSDEKHLSGNSTIDISHESLIRQWRKLRKWTREESSDRRVKKKLSNEALKWDESGRGKEDVLAGVKLAEALEWQQRHTGEINHPNLQVEREYLEASTSRRDEKVREEEELKHAESLSRNNRRLTLGLLVAGVLAFIASVFWILALQAGVNARARESAANLEMRRAHALRLASEAEDEIGRPQRRLLLALEAINQSPDEVRATSQFFDALKIFEPSGIRCQALSGHQCAISAISVDSNQEKGNAKWLATGGTDGVIFVWDLEELADNGQVLATPVKTLLGHATAITEIDFSPNGKSLASGSEDGDRFSWPLDNGDEFPQPSPDHAANGTLPATTSKDERITAIELNAGPNQLLADIVFDKWIAKAFSSGEIHLFQVKNGPAENPVKLIAHEGAVRHLAFLERQDPKANFLISAGDDAIVRLWRLPADSAFEKITRSHYDAMFTRNGEAIVTMETTDEAIKVNFHDLSSASASKNQQLFYESFQRDPGTLKRDPNSLIDVAISPSGYFAIGGSREVVLKKPDNENTFEPITIETNDGLVLSLEEDYPRWLALLIKDQVKLYRCRPESHDFELPQEIDFAGEDRGAVFSSPPHSRLAIWNNTQVKLYDLPVNSAATAMEPNPQSSIVRPHDLGDADNDVVQGNPIQIVKFGPKTKHLAAVRGDEIILWKLGAAPSMKTPIFLRGHAGPITSFAFDKDENWLVTGSDDKTVRIWDLSGPEPTEAKRLVTHRATVRSVSLSDDQTWLVTADDTDTIFLWDFKNVLDLEAPARPVNFRFGGQIDALAFNGNTLLNFNVDGSLWRWKLERRNLNQLIELATNSVGRYFTLEELADIWPGVAITTIYKTASNEVRALPPPHYSALVEIVKRIGEGKQAEDEAITEVTDLFSCAKDPKARQKATWFINYYRGKTVVESASIDQLTLKSATDEATRYFEKITGDSSHANQIVLGLLKRKTKLLVKGDKEGREKVELALELANQLGALDSWIGLERTQNQAEIKRDLAISALNHGKIDDAIARFDERISLIKENRLEFGTDEAQQLRAIGDRMFQRFDVEPTDVAKQYAIQFYGLANDIQLGIVDDAGARAAEQAFIKLRDAGTWMARRGNVDEAIEMFGLAEQLGGGRKLSFDATTEANKLGARWFYQEGLQRASSAGKYYSLADDRKANELKALATEKFEQAKKLDPEIMDYDPQNESARISSATKKRKGSEDSFTQGREAIQLNKLDEATHYFEEACNNDESLDFEPTRFVDLVVGLELIQKGKNIAISGNEQDATATFEKAKQKLISSGIPDPFDRLGYEPQRLAKQYSLNSHLNDSQRDPRKDLNGTESSPGTLARQYAMNGQIPEAIDVLKSAQSFDPALNISATTWNNVCWFACLSDSKNAKNYLVYGELAVQLAPDQANYRDTRGLARALSGDRPGAIKDFEAFVAWAWDRDDLRTQRQEWVDKLRDEVPIDQIFTDDVIKVLKSQ